MSTSRRTFLAFAGAGSAGLGLGVAFGAEAAGTGGHGLPILSTHVAGTDRYDAPASLEGLAEGNPVTLKREPENGYDTRAVSVWSQDGRRKLGYVPRIHNQALASLMDAGVPALARVSFLKGRPGRPDIGLDVNVVLPA